MQPKTMKCKNNGCGTAPGNLVPLINVYFSHPLKYFPLCVIIISSFAFAPVYFCRVRYGGTLEDVVFEFKKCRPTDA